ncbi:MAG TPA: EF-P beta-lysylation protein EpmB [Sedimenticola sp.]|nr:EF-P beta-lysylation protein EpmB [Sedimenticola sp.]
MIPFSGALTNTERWQRQLAESFRSPRALLEHLELAHLWHPRMEEAAAAFPLRVTRYFAGLMKKGDPADPLLLQVLPSARELEAAPGYSEDPTGDGPARTGPGVLRKYHGRALVIATGSCAVHCRYCFRRHYPYQENRPDARDWSDVVESLAADPTLSEAILSGGDPLALADSRLQGLVDGLARLPHLQRLRIHTRLPVVLPQRIDTGLVRLLAGNRLKCALVLHANHPAEVTTALAAALTPLRRAGVTLLNQAVLLKGINDRLDLQTELCEKLFDIGVLPYYLHQLDKVSGAAHFEVSKNRAKALHEEMRVQLPGYLLPRLVEERAGAASKLPL